MEGGVKILLPNAAFLVWIGALYGRHLQIIMLQKYDLVYLLVGVNDHLEQAACCYLAGVKLDQGGFVYSMDIFLKAQLPF